MRTGEWMSKWVSEGRCISFHFGFEALIKQPIVDLSLPLGSWYVVGINQWNWVDEIELFRKVDW